jgi:hypothetical protein
MSGEGFGEVAVAALAPGYPDPRRPQAPSRAETHVELLSDVRFMVPARS